MTGTCALWHERAGAVTTTQPPPLPSQVPFLFKYTVDALAAGTPEAQATITMAGVMAPTALILGYGCARAGSTVMSELRNVVFAKVAQGTIRKVGNQVSLYLQACSFLGSMPPALCHSAGKDLQPMCCVFCKCQLHVRGTGRLNESHGELVSLSLPEVAPAALAAGAHTSAEPRSSIPCESTNRRPGARH